MAAMYLSRFAVAHALLNLLMLSYAFALQDIELQEPFYVEHGFLQTNLRGSEQNFPHKSDTSDGVPMRYLAMLDALDKMQDNYFSCPLGSWPEAIDWTAEVIASQISTTLLTISEYSNNHSSTADPIQVEKYENLINRYFTHITSFYFGEDAFSLRNEAYDDMLWVVLNWLESIRFIRRHSKSHFPIREASDRHASSWYAEQFVPQFAHRARIFYDLAAKGWDKTLCGGGMVWNPRLAPYKNTITNQLYITASIYMYLYFPGDSDASPFFSTAAGGDNDSDDSRGRTATHPPTRVHDPKFLSSAVAGYQWLRSSGLRNSQGLYADGFHIRGWRRGRNPSNGTGNCDLIDEKVYTYNQGVILSGLRGLWQVTGNLVYFEDGHELVRTVIHATGWQNREDGERKYVWAGLGRGGVLEEECDWSGSCNQDGQTFKGIFFWHLANFCGPLPTMEDDDEDGKLDKPWLKDEVVRSLHRQRCRAYEAWVKTNAKAAWATRDEDGLMGSWWGRVSTSSSSTGNGPDEGEDDVGLEAPAESEDTDYRNRGVPWDDIWRISTDDAEDNESSKDTALLVAKESKLQLLEAVQHAGVLKARFPPRHRTLRAKDLNDRGRGRTVETQSGGLAVLKAAWKMQLDRERNR